MKTKCVISGLVLVCLFTVVNIIKSIQVSGNITDIVLNRVESLASGESMGGDDLKQATSQVCYLEKKYYDENSGRIVTTTVEGRVGICDGDPGPCRSWNCTEVM